MQVRRRYSDFFSLKAAFIPPVVKTGMDQILANLLTGDNTYGHTGPRNTSGLLRYNNKVRPFPLVGSVQVLYKHVRG